jgi:hypothetical protein
MSALSPVQFDAPLVNPSPTGLFAATQWTDFGEGSPLRWLPSGVDVRVYNFGGDDAFGVWTADWNAAESDLGEGDLKAGVRPEFPDTFLPLTTYGFDECDITAPSRDEIRTRAAQVHRIQEANAVETQVGERLLDDAPTPTSVASILAAVSHLEGVLAATNTLGFIHAGAQWAASAAQAQLIVRSGSTLRTPLGHTWVFGGGYVDTLDRTFVASSQPFGWRGPVVVRDALDYHLNRFVAVAERSLVIGYETVVGAAAVAAGGYPGDEPIE